MSTPAVGIVLAALVDVLLPAALAIPVILRNRRRRTSPATDRTAWILMAVILVLVGFSVWVGLLDVYRYEGGGVIGATIAALPGSVIPAMFNSNVIAGFFTDREWAQFGYFTVLTIYVSGMLLWALLNVTVLRMLVSMVRWAFGRDQKTNGPPPEGRPVVL